MDELDYELDYSLWLKVVIYYIDNRINTNVQKWQYSPSTLPWLCIIPYINPNPNNPHPNPNKRMRMMMTLDWLVKLMGRR